MTRRASEAAARDVLGEMQSVTTSLLSEGLADDYSWPVLKQGIDHVVVSGDTAVDASVLKATSYEALYEGQLQAHAFNIRLPDAALLQMSYRFEGGRLATHRLAYLPSPNQEPFQNDPDLYVRDQLFADIVGPQVSSVPLRFDFDARDGVAREGTHSVAHLTLGQYKHCRIPVSGPVTPNTFVGFVMTHFYSTPDRSAIELSHSELDGFGATLTAVEAGGTHLRLAGAII